MFSALSNFVFGASSIFSSQQRSDAAKGITWRDKRLCFDLRSHDLELDKGEELVGCFFPIEDVKGNPDQPGLLKVTNLRIIWVCCQKKRVNLSIGWRSVTATYEQGARDSLFGVNSSMFVLCKYDGTKYEFVFKFDQAQTERPRRGPAGDYLNAEIWKATRQLMTVHKENPNLVTYLTPMFRIRPFEVIETAWLSYKHTHLFRHCRSNLAQLVRMDGALDMARSNPIKSTYVQLLPSESVEDEFEPVTYAVNRNATFSDDGLFLITNVRLIWVSKKLPEVNLSIPYLRIISVKYNQNSGPVIETHDFMAPGSSTIHFRNPGSPQRTFLRVEKFFKRYKPLPRYGPESCGKFAQLSLQLRPIGPYLDAIEMLTQNLHKDMPPTGAKMDGQPDEGASGATGSVSGNGVAADREPNKGLSEVSLGEEAPGKAASEMDRSTSRSRQSQADNERVYGDDTDSDDRENDDQVELAERDFNGSVMYRAISYLNEQPLSTDHELIYFKDFGLAMEKPKNGASVHSIWRIPA